MAIEKLKIFFETLVSSELQQKFLLFKITFFAILIIFLSLFFYFLFASEYCYFKFIRDLKNFLFAKEVLPKKTKKKLQKLKEKIAKKETPADWKLAVIKGGKLLEKSLDIAGFKGGNLSERANLLKEVLEIPTEEFQEILKNLKVYQGLLEDPNYLLTKKEAEDFFKSCEKILELLGLI